MITLDKLLKDLNPESLNEIVAGLAGRGAGGLSPAGSKAKGQSNKSHKSNKTNKSNKTTKHGSTQKATLIVGT